MPFTGQTGNAQAENASATLILIGCRDVKQLRSANQILRILFQCQSWRKFLWMCLHLLTLQLCTEGLTLGDLILKWKKSHIFSFFLVKTRTVCTCRQGWRKLTRQPFEIKTGDNGACYVPEKLLNKLKITKKMLNSLSSHTGMFVSTKL